MYILSISSYIICIHLYININVTYIQLRSLYVTQSISASTNHVIAWQYIESIETLRIQQTTIQIFIL